MDSASQNITRGFGTSPRDPIVVFAHRMPSAIRHFRYWKAVGCDHSLDFPTGAGMVSSFPLSASRMACFSKGIAAAI